MSGRGKANLQRTLSWFLTIAMFSAIFFPVLFVGSYEVYRQYQKEVIIGPEQDAKALFVVLKKGLIAPLWSYTPENAKDLINGVALNPAVEAVIVKDATGEVFSAFSRDVLGEESDRIHLVSDVFFEEQVIGSVDLVFNYSSAKSLVSAYAIQIILITLFQLVVSISIILLILKYRVTEPLRSLKRFATEVSKQHFDSPSPEVKNREFIELADELDAMRTALHSSFTELEEKVEQRTKTLRDTNLELESALENIERTQETLVQNEKLAALGALVAGIAHELNTPIGNARLVTSSLREDARSLKHLSEEGKLTKSEFEHLTSDISDATSLIERNIAKAVTLIQSFKQVAVDRTSDRKREFSLNGFVADILSTMHHITKNTCINIETELDEDCDLYSYPGTLSQIIDNLVNNAVLHAFEGLQLTKEMPGVIVISTQVSEKNVSISVSDNGIGLTRDVQSKIFEPFYTTKLGKGGSGLGMHIVHNLVNGPLEGQIIIKSKPKQGTTFVLTIPKQLSKQPDDVAV